MHENKFEKQVSEKMDQLGFDPSDAVWARVDQEINSEKKKRKPIFWIFLLSGLMIAGGATYMAMNRFTPVEKAKTKSENATATNQDSQQNNQIQVEKKRPAETNPSLAGEGKNMLARKTKGNTEKSTVAEKEIGQKAESKAQPPIETVAAEENTVSADSPKVAQVNGAQLNKTARVDSVSGTGVAKIKNKESKKSSWSVGFAGSAGVSNINQSLFQPLNPANLSYAAYYPSSTGSGTPTVINTPSETNAGFSFALGVTLKRNLSKRVSLSTGLGYHYYSSGIHTGISVDSALTINYGFAQSTSVNSYYRNGEGKEFTNQYHFIELPLNLSFQLNKSRKSPVNWEAGISLAWLMSSNALLFDPYTNVYFENNQLFNKIQWTAETAILIGFPVHDRTLQIGPQIQYSLTSLLKNSSTYPGHLIYFGLKCTFSR